MGNIESIVPQRVSAKARGEGVGRHRGRPRMADDLVHCCFAGCTLVNCPRCTRQICVRQGFHDCRPYEGKHRAGA